MPVRGLVVQQHAVCLAAAPGAAQPVQHSCEGHASREAGHGNGTGRALAAVAYAGPAGAAAPAGGDQAPTRTVRYIGPYNDASQLAFADVGVRRARLDFLPAGRKRRGCSGPIFPVVAIPRAGLSLDQALYGF